MDKNAYEVRLASWAKVIAEANNSGMTRSAWCAEYGITVRKFQYWQKKVREYLLEHPDVFPSALTDLRSSAPAMSDAQSFYEIELSHPATPSTAVKPLPAEKVFPAPAPLILKFGGFQLQINDGFRESTLVSVIRAVKNA